MLKIVFSHNLLYFAPLIMFIDGPCLDNHFQALFLSFYCFYCCCCCCCYCWFHILFFYFYSFIIFVLILFGFVRCYFLRLLGIPIIYVRDVWKPFYVIFSICNFIITFFIAFFKYFFFLINSFTFLISL